MMLVKIGGAVLTDKTRYRTLLEDVLARLAREVASANRAVTLVHGAGSFGHVVAKEHALHEGRRGTRAQDAGAARVHRDVRALNAHVLAALADAGVPAVGVSPLDVAELDGGTLHAWDAAAFRRVLSWGFTPVTFGDLVPDRARGWGIFSGDVILESLARDLEPEGVVAVTDVDGLFDRPPAEAGARLLERVTPEDAVAALAGGSAGIDVTGGMAGKIARLAAIARTGIPVWLVNGKEPGRLADALAGKDVVGTRIVPAP